MLTLMPAPRACGRTREAECAAPCRRGWRASAGSSPASPAPRGHVRRAAGAPRMGSLEPGGASLGISQLRLDRLALLDGLLPFDRVARIEIALHVHRHVLQLGPQL